ncbi:MAG: PD-(D/E)XK nuclease family protein [Oscillibacter sp.]|nr:PD-(D/E)XK nuclease family protein [Oscillibacter sp.]MEA4992918.1 PD-(D/E)XK nuclease family protein [Oscillibacter sp.]
MRFFKVRSGAEEGKEAMLKILMGRARSGKSRRILGEIAEKGDSSRQILLVPEHASHQAEVDLCCVCGDTASRHAEVLSFRRLATRVLAITGGAADVSIDAGGKLLLLQRSLTELAPVLKVYRRPSQRAGFLEQLLGLLDELTSYAVSPMTLAAQAEDIPGAMGDKLRDLAFIYANYEAHLHRPEKDGRDRIVKLRDHLEESGYADGRDVYLDGFSYFNGLEVEILSVLLRRAASVTVTLLGDEHDAGEIFEVSVRTRDRLRRLAESAGVPFEIQYVASWDDSPMGLVERSFFDGDETWEGETSAVRLREADSAFTEVEQTAADILRLVKTEKCRFRDITVAARNMKDYESVIENVFERYGVPVYLSRRSDILEKPVLSLLTGALDAVTGGCEYEDMFHYLKTGLARLSPEECDRLENYALTWEIHGSLWLREADWSANPGGYGAPWTDARQAELAELNGLRRRVRGPLKLLSDGMKAAQTAREQVNALYSFMETLHLQSSLEEQLLALGNQGELQTAEETGQLWGILCGVLDQFVEILGDEAMDAETFTRLFRLLLTQYSVGTIPPALDQVSASEITRNDRHTAKYLFLLGANDHVLPAVAQRGGVLNDEDREELAARGIRLAPTGMEQFNVELQNLYAALAQPTDGLTVSYPVSDVNGARLRPSFVVERLEKLFPENRVERENGKREYRLAALAPALEAAGANPGGPVWRWFAEKSEWAARLKAMERAAAMGRGRLSLPAVRALYGEQFSMSASRLERLRQCHFAYFMQYGLKARQRKTASFDAPQIGTFLHFILENVTEEAAKQGGFATVSREMLHKLTDRFMDEYVQRELPNLQDRTARFRYLYSRLRTTAYAVVEETARELAQSDFVPVEFELSFGDKGTLPAVTVSEPDGELRVNGKVDRIDGWLKDGRLYLRVVDYKTGKKTFDLAEVRMGLDIQMLLYLFTLKNQGSADFGREVVPAGVLYLPARDEILAQERNVTPERLAQERAKALRRSGLLLNEPEVLQAMEHDALTEPKYLPLRVDREGNLSGGIATAAQLGRLGSYVERLLHDIAAEVRDGVIDADPCCHDENDSVCRFCDWAGACHFEDGRGGDRLRYIRKVTAAEFWQELDREEDGRG